MQPARPARRTIPTLEPAFFESIHERLLARGGSDSSTAIAYGVGNAVYNTGCQFFGRTYNRRAERDFTALFENRTPEDRTAADRMIDFIVHHAPEADGPDGFLPTLVNRLDDVLSRPA